MHILKKNEKNNAKKNISVATFEKKVRLLLIACVVLVLLIAGIFVYEKYTIRTVYVEGNTHYTDEEIKDMVIDGKLSNNSIYLSILYRNKEIKDVPFIETMDVSILSPDTIQINVFEKALAGYVDFL